MAKLKPEDLAKIAQRMKSSVMENIKPQEMDIQIDDRKTNRSPGIGIVLSYIGHDRFLGVDMLGEKGVPAETIGKKAAIEMKDMIDSGVTMDDHGCDQVMLLAALARNDQQITFQNKTKHIETNLMIIDRFMPDTLAINRSNDYYILNNIN